VLVGFVLYPAAAGAAEPVGLFPVEELVGPARSPDLAFIEPGQQRAQRLQFKSLRRGLAGLQGCRIAGAAVERSDELAEAERDAGI
jgi:hypothetical protein